MQPSIFNPWAWRDPSALAGGYTQTTPSAEPADTPDGGHDGPDAPGPGTAVDLVGYHVQARDGRIGTIDEASDEADAGHLVVDTGPWILGQKVQLPAGTVERVDRSAVPGPRRQVLRGPSRATSGSGAAGGVRSPGSGRRGRRPPARCRARVPDQLRRRR
ncbi:PRC-barrel domain containing protein [Micromonospora sp. NPDC049102]|uniref:PRC-barrel domain containing protein n=1 Tax=Micromonospora sp. NPDC049102 TaxID=3364265 RepID=UPI0037132BA5